MGVKEYKIALIPGDGIGPEVTDEALKVLRAAGQKYGFGLKTTHYPWSGNHYLETGVLMPDSALEEYRQHDAVMLGAIGDPRLETGLLERAVVAGCRFGLDLYVNLRPIKLYAPHLCPLKNDDPKNIDMMVIRENTEDLYVGTHGFFKKGTADEVATQELLLTRKGTERVIRYAFDVARTRPRKKLTMVDKANAVRAYDLWTRVFAEVGKEYPDIEQDHAYVDACTMWLVKNPEWFDTVVVPNMFGDIITDLGAMLQGGMGAAASGNIHPGKAGMFEPIHGSAPKYAGKNVANPVAAVASVQLLLDFVGEKKAAAAVEDAIAEALRTRKIPALTANCGLSTSQIGDLLAGSVRG
jgi:3-isopropylmalate dehydrogenase